jgi:glyceraldehyde-3-phosphate dehydrogenase (NAD(P))
MNKMERKIVHIVGTGTIGEPLIGILCEQKSNLGIDEITFHKHSALTKDKPKIDNLIKKGARLSVLEDRIDDFKAIGLEPEFTLEEAIARSSVVIDCTPGGSGLLNKEQYYSKYTDRVKGFLAQGSENGFGKKYARGINDHVISSDDQFLQVVSCNTHNIACLVNTLALSIAPDNLLNGKFVCIRRSNDISQTGNYVPAPTVNSHEHEMYGTHHAEDAVDLFKTMDLDLDLFSSALKTNTQYMHTVWFNIKVKENTSKDKVIELLDNNVRIALTEHRSSNAVFSFGRDQGQYGRILNQTVIVEDSINVRNGNEISGFCFTPQDGNSILSSIAATVKFLNPHSYQDKINSLAPFFFDRV